jgi:hypothetical protein
MAVPAEFVEHGQVLEAKDRSRGSGILVDESFAFGPYAVKKVDRNWDHTRESSAGAVSTKTSEGGYSYQLEAGALKLVARCQARSGGTEADLGKGFSLSTGGHASLDCRCDAGASLNLEGDEETFRGTLTLDDRLYTLRAILELENGSEQRLPAGYRIDADEPLGAVEVEHPGRAWLPEDMPESSRIKLSCLFAGLMLYQPPTLR